MVSSDLPRALHTAQAIAQACGLGPPRTLPLLQERNFGDLRGTPYDALDHDPLTRLAAPPGGESMADFVHRCGQAWAELLRLQAALAGTLAVVTHGLVIRAWLNAGLWRLPDWPDGPDQPDGPVRPTPPPCTLPAHLANTGVTAVQAAPPHRVLCLNRTAHLDTGGPDLADAAAGLSGG